MDVDLRPLLEATNEWMAVFGPIMAVGAGISIALAILSFVGKKMIDAAQWQDERKAHDEEEEKEKGIPPAYQQALNRLLDRVLGEPLEKRKNDDAEFDDEVVYVDFPDEEARLK